MQPRARPGRWLWHQNRAKGQPSIRGGDGSLKLGARMECSTRGVFVTAQCSPEGHVPPQAPSMASAPRAEGTSPVLGATLGRERLGSSWGWWCAKSQARGAVTVLSLEHGDFIRGIYPAADSPPHLLSRAMLFPRVATLGFQSPGLEDGALPSMEASVEPLDAAKLGTWQRQAVEGNCSFYCIHPYSCGSGILLPGEAIQDIPLTGS